MHITVNLLLNRLSFKSGHAVLEVENDTLIEIHPNGKKKVIKKVLPSDKVIRGQRIILS